MYVLFDIGGTKTRVAYATDLTSFEEPTIIETSPNYEVGRDALIGAIRVCARGREIKAICGGIAGPLDAKTKHLIGSPNLHDWIGKPLAEEVEVALRAKVYIENDSAMVGLGEAVFGAGQGSNIVAYITVSTGVGGARLVNGIIDEKTIGFEPGHQTIDADHTLARGVESPDVSDLLSGRAVEKRMGKKPKEITDPMFWEKMARYLAYALNNVVVFWSPDCIVLGGSMITGDPAIPLDSTRTYLKEIMNIFPDVPPLKKAELRDVGGLYGALAYLKNIENGIM